MYDIETYEEAVDQLDAMPLDLLGSYATVLDQLRFAPWAGEPYHSGKPESSMRQMTFGADGRAVVVYLVLEHQRRVDVLRLYWVD